MTIRNLDIEAELIRVNFSRGENLNEEFLKLNPTGHVPVLIEDDGFILTESRAIIAYLVASRDDNSSLYPLNDPIKRALIDERLYYDATTVFHSHVQILVRKSGFSSGVFTFVTYVELARYFGRKYIQT
jgi:glutathione S-transferase